jgi:hypothetical protein
MSSGRQALTIVGQVAGAAIGGPIGAAIGGAIGGEIGGFIDGPPEGPRLDDTSAPAIEYGSQVPRLYGRVWCTLSPRWWSGLRESAEVVGGKGGDSGQEQYSYRADLLGVLGEVDLTRWPDPVWTRIRIDGKIVASRLASSSTDTLTNTAETEDWSDVELFNGDAAQAPWSVMEAVEGATNAIAYRGQVTIGFTNLLMPGGRRPSLIEVEVCTDATAVTGLANCVLQANFVSDASDSSYYNNTPAVVGSWSYGPNLSTGVSNANKEVVWSDADMAVRSATGFTLQTRVTLRAMDFGDSAAGQNIILRMDWVSGATRTLSLAAERRFSGDLELIASDGTTEYWRISVAQDQSYHVAFVVSAGASPTLDVYLDGTVAYSGAFTNWPSTSATVYTEMFSTFGTRGWELAWVDLWMLPLYSADFAAPAEPDAPDAPLGSFTPLTVDLQDVLESEMLRCEPLTSAHIDMAAAAGKEVYGFKAAGSAAQSCATLLDWYYLDLFCAATITAVARGGSSEQTIAYGYSGAGLGGASDPFAGLVRGADVEQQRSTSVGYINILADGEAGSENGDRIGTGNAIRQISFPLYSIASAAKGRANSITHDTRVAAHKATVRFSARYGALMQPASVVTLTDNKALSYRVRVLRLVWNQGVYEADVCLDDPTILTDVGVASDADTQAIEVPAPGIAEFIALDLPKLLPADNEPGYLGLVKTPDAAGARWFDSADDVTYAARADYVNDATFGTVTAKTGSFNRGVLFDETSTLTVDVGDGVLTSTTHAALLGSRALNAFAVGVNVRLALGQYRTATLVSPGIYRLTGFVNMGAKGTERFCAGIIVGDSFALLGTAGTNRIPRTLPTLGVPTYTKAVAVGRTLAGVTAVPLTPYGVSLKPLAPVDLRANRNATSGDIVLSALRRTRDDCRFGGALGDACPLGEAIDLRRWRLYTSSAFTTVLRELGTTTNAATATYTSAQRATDGHSLYGSLFVGVAQMSDTMGAGYELTGTI